MADIVHKHGADYVNVAQTILNILYETCHQVLEKANQAAKSNKRNLNGCSIVTLIDWFSHGVCDASALPIDVLYFDTLGRCK
ncbi:hypothetical protein Plhal710r2_c014g0062761 [Plasmopara halstedii]